MRAQGAHLILQEARVGELVARQAHHEANPLFSGLSIDAVSSGRRRARDRATPGFFATTLVC
jgi:hypothetical protein